jgi:hypothetical protein
LTHTCIRGYLNIESGFEPGLESGLEPGLESGLEPGLKLGLEPGLELGLEPGLEPKMTSSDFDGCKFTNSVLTFKELSLNLVYSFTNNAKCLRKFN